jgi:hypothetical protein
MINLIILESFLIQNVFFCYLQFHFESVLVAGWAVNTKTETEEVQLL